jgi:hypothetical protein
VYLPIERKWQILESKCYANTYNLQYNHKMILSRLYLSTFMITGTSVYLYIYTKANADVSKYSPVITQSRTLLSDTST